MPRIKIVLATLCGLKAAALAQAVPTTPVPTPPFPGRNTQPTDFPAPGIRGQTTPTPAGAAQSSQQAAPSGYSGGDYVMADSDPGLYGGRQRVRRTVHIPEYHEVKQGDTLWRLCDHYYGDPWMWPKLWAYNRSITNPHWIYPGDKIRMIDGKPGVTTDRGELADAGSDLMTSQTRYGRGPITLRQYGFVDKGELGKAGKIEGSKLEKLMLTGYDEAYVRGGERFRPQVGKSYSIYKIRRELRSGDKVYGNIVEILGTLRVKRVNDKGIATAEITEAVNPIERGHLVGPLRRSFARLAARPAEISVEGKLIDTYRNCKHVGTDELVFIDRGRRHGVRVGNRFLVLRRGDGYRRVIVDKEKDNPDFPNEVIAEISVVDLRDNLSVGLVARTLKELRKGERVRLRRGY